MSKSVLQALAFENHPDPMWVYALDSLKFLEVNPAAVRRYGYSRDEFLSMRISDIRPQEDVAALVENVRSVTSGQDRAGVWRHLTRDGRLIHVDITSHTLEWAGQKAELVCARDVSEQVALERQNRELLERERARSREATAAADHFRQLFEAVPGKYVVLAPADYEIVAVSDDYLKSTATTRAEIKGRRLFDVFPPDLGEGAAESMTYLDRSLARVRSTGRADVMTVFRYPVRHPASEGGRVEDRYWTAVNSPIHGPGGSLAFIVHRVEDVTAAILSGDDEAREALDEIHEPEAQLRLEILLRSRELQAANAALLEQEANLRTAQRLLRLGLWKLDLDTLRLSGSDIARENLGVPPGEGLHAFADFLALVHPDDRAALKRDLEAFLASGDQSFEFEYRVLRPDGEVRTLRGNGEVASQPGGGRILTGVVQDITRQRAAEQRRQEAHSLLRIASRAARLGTWRVTLDPMEMTWSAETAAIHEEPRGTSPTVERGIEYYAPEYRERIREVFFACASEGKPYDEVLQIITAKGKRIWVRAIGEAEYGADGAICAVRGAFQDVSQLMQARQEAEDLSERLRQAQKLEALGQLTGGVAHDFNNLLTVIMGNAELLAARLEGEAAARELVESILSAADSGAALTGQLLAFARRQPLQPRVIALGELIARMDRLLKRTLGENVEVQVTREQGATDWAVELDPAQFDNALLNLALNARDAMEDGGRVSVETARLAPAQVRRQVGDRSVDREFVRVSVSDTGSGMPPEVLERAFDPFFTTKPERKGTGLGLSMVYGFVKQSGGYAKIDSEPGQGTTVRLYFPRVQANPGDPGLEDDAGSQPSAGHEHILVVEDDPPVRESLVRQLRELGYRATSVADGREALAVLELSPDVDLLLTDIVMPGGMNGRELADRAVARDPSLRVLFTSGYAQDALVHDGRVDPGLHLLSKPYRLSELAAAIRRVLDGD